MAALIGALRATLSADTANFEQGMKRAQRQAATSSSAISKSLGVVKAGIAGFVSALSVGMLTGAIKNALDYAGSLGEVSQQLGVSTKLLQTFRYNVQQNGGSLEDADKSLGKFSISLSKALSGSVQTQKAFQAVGVSLDDLRTKSDTEIIGQIADGMKATGGASANAAAGVAIFGRGFQKIIPVLDQGSKGMNAAARAAQELGIVLSDDLINQADEAADKVDKLMTVLQVQIAGAVANNANAIAGFVQGLIDLIAKLQAAALWMDNFRAKFNAYVYQKAGLEKEAARARGSAFQSGVNPTVPGRSVTVRLAPAKSPATPAPTGTPSQFLAPRGGGGRGGRSGVDAAAEAERKRIEALRDAYQYDQEIRRAQMDVLRATQSLATDFSERATIAVQMLDAERAAYVAELDYEVAAKEMTAAQAASLLALYDQKDAMERRALIADEEAQRAEASARLDQVTLELDRNKLESEAQLAETAEAERRVRLRLLDLAYKQERTRLEAILADQQATAAAKEEARRRLQGLNETYANDRAGVVASTRGPWEEHMASLPLTADKAREALQRLEVEGFNGLIDAALELQNGFDSAGKALLNVLKDFLTGLLRMELQKGMAQLFPNGLISALPKGIPGFHTGGSMRLGGIGGIDRNLLSMNGLPIARVSRGEMLNVTPANDQLGRGDVTMNIYTSDADSFRRSERQINRDLRRRLA